MLTEKTRKRIWNHYDRDGLLTPHVDTWRAAVPFGLFVFCTVYSKESKESNILVCQSLKTKVASEDGAVTCPILKGRRPQRQKGVLMAKDGTNRGGKRIGAGRKPKPLAEKLQEGKKAEAISLRAY